MKKISELNQYSEILEKELLSLLFQSVELTLKAQVIINESDFYKYGNIFKIFCESYKNKTNIYSALEGVPFSEILDSDFSLRSVEDVCNELKKVSQTRKVWQIIGKVSESLDPKEITGQVANLQKDILTEVSSSHLEVSDISKLMEEYETERNLYKNKKGDLIGITTGYEKLDKIIDGLRPGHLIVIGGYTNVGKTAASLNIVSTLIKNKRRCVIYSLEMGKVDIISRILGIMSNKNGLSILKGFVEANENEDKLKKSGLAIYSEKTDLDIIIFSMMEETIKKPVDLFVVDFIQNIQVKKSNSEYEKISEAIITFQQIAKKLKVPIIVLSQISNEGARSQDNFVMSFKGSGTVAAAADLAIEIRVGEENIEEWKKRLYAGEPVKMIWNIRKNRHGKVGYIEMSFDGATGVFEPYDKDLEEMVKTKDDEEIKMPKDW